MAIETGSVRSRRALLGAALGGAAAIAATAAAPLTALANTGDGTNAQLGTANTSNTVTSFENLDDAEASLAGFHSATGSAVTGTSVMGAGIDGWSSDATPSTWPTASHRTGVLAAVGDRSGASTNTDETGIYGFAGVSGFSNGVWGDSSEGTGVWGTGYWGVYGQGGIAISGDAGPSGVGVYGWTGAGAPPNPPTRLGVGVYARAETLNQTALQVVGKVKFDRCGKLSIGATQSSKKFTKSGVTTSSLILVTLQSSVSGLYVKAVTPTAGAFTVYLSKAPGKTIYFSYFIING